MSRRGKTEKLVRNFFVFASLSELKRVPFRTNMTFELRGLTTWTLNCLHFTVCESWVWTYPLFGGGSAALEFLLRSRVTQSSLKVFVVLGPRARAPLVRVFGAPKGARARARTQAPRRGVFGGSWCPHGLLLLGYPLTRVSIDLRELRVTSISPLSMAQ